MPNIGQMPLLATLYRVLLRPPVFEGDEDKTRLARTLHFGLTALIISLLINLPTTLVFGEHKWVGATIELVSLGAAGAAAYWMRAGHVRSAAKFLALYAWLVVSLLVYLSDGLSTIAPSLYAPVIVLTLLFVGWRASLLSAAATLLFTLLFLIASELGHHPPIIFPLNGLTPWTLFAMGLICMLIPIASVYHEVTEALQAARDQLALREKAEVALRKSEERFRLITSITSDYTFTSVILDNGLPKNVAISGAFEAITGYTFEEYEAMGGYRASIHPADVAEDDRVLDILKTNQPVVSELRIITKNGEVRWTRANATPVWDSTQNRLVGIIGAVRDITAEKLAEQALHENEEKFRTIFDLAPYGITVQESGGQFLDVNQAFLDITGLTRDEVIGHNAADLDLFPNQVYIKDLMQQVAQEGRIVNRELVVHPHNAPPRSLLISSQRIFLAGRVIVLTVGVDITERKQAEQALRESEERFRLISSATSDYTFAAIVNEEGQIVRSDATGALEAINGYTPEEYQAIGGWWATLHPDDVAQDQADFAALKTNQPIVSELRIIRKDGHVRWVRVNAVPIWDAEKNRLVGINGGVSDIHERKTAENAILSLNDELREQTTYLTTLNDVARAVTGLTDFKSTLHNVFKVLEAVVPFDAFYIALYDPITDEVDFPITFDDGEFYDEERGRLKPGSYLERLIKTGEPLFLNRTTEELAALTKPFTPVGNAERVSASIIMVPLPYGGQNIGALSTQSYTLNMYTPKHVELLRGVAYIVATAIENARLYEGLQQELADRKTLNDIAYAVAYLTDLQTTLLNVFEQLRAVIPFDAFYVSLYHPDTDELSFPILFDNGIFYAAPPRRKPAGMFGNAHVLATGATVFKNFTPEETAELAKAPNLMGDTSRVTTSVVVAPLPYRGTIIGTISTQSYTPNAYSQRHADSLRGAGYVVATAVENARLYEGLQQELADRKTLNDIAQAVASLSDLKSTLLTVFEQLTAVIPFDAFYVGLYDAERDEVQFPILFENGKFYEEAPRSPDKVFGNRHALTTGEMVYKNLTQAEITAYLDSPHLMGDTSRPTASLMVAPLPYRGKMIGTISTQSYTANAYSEKHADSLRGAAYIVATAIENARLYDGLQRELNHRQALNEMAFAVTGLTDLKTTLQRVFDQLTAVIPFDAFYVALYDPERDELTFPIMFENGKFYDQAPRKPAMLFGNAEVLKTGQMVYRNHTAEEVASFKSTPTGMGDPNRVTASVMVAPLPYRGKIIGTISTQSYTMNAYTDKHADSLRGAAYIVATAIENARLYDGLQRELSRRQALNDMAFAVTGLSDLNTTLRIVFEQLGKVVPTDAFYVALYDPLTNLLTYPIMLDSGQYYDVPDHTLDPKDRFMQVITENRPMLNNRSAAEIEEAAQSRFLIGDTSKVSASLMAVPLPHRGNIIGMVSVQSYTLNAYTQSHLELLLGAAYIVATAIENARLYEGLQQELAQRRAAEEAMRRSEAHLRALLDATTDIAFLMSRDGRFLTVNRTMASVIGQSTDDLIGHNGFDLLGSNLRIERLKHFLKVTETGQPERWEDRADNFWWDNNLYPVISTSGDVEAFALYSRNVTEQKRLEAELQQYTARLEQMVEERTVALRSAKEQIELILHNSTDALALAQPNGDIQTRNPAFEAMFGDQVTLGIEDIVNTLVEDEHKAMFSHALNDAARHQQTQRMVARIIARDGSEKDIDLALIPVNLTDREGSQGLLLSAHDITHFKEMERFKTRFVENALHDLGTPIAGLISRIYLLKQTPDMLNQHLAKMQNQTEHLKNLLDDLRFVAELDRREIDLDLEPVNLNQLVVRVFDTYEPIALSQNQALELKIDAALPVMPLDSRRMERVLVNLVSNAINYTPAGKRVILETRFDEDNIYFAVQDEGIGISAADLPHVFERFFRSPDARDQHAGGTGLGLAIVKEVVELHGSTVTVTSEVGVGSTFTVSLPYQRPAAK
ncbi:MAG: hypothetical protein BroJett018_29610 [Chloroflexota bacterium]|nr:MAG: hypothetical protein BroJett018_29610 [Chloroflexota bacterium]